jgi:hypothetical protein
MAFGMFAGAVARGVEQRRRRVLAAERLVVTRVTTPSPPRPPSSAQKRSGFEQALAILTSPSAVTISASTRLAPARP